MQLLLGYDKGTAAIYVQMKDVIIFFPGSFLKGICFQADIHKWSYGISGLIYHVFMRSSHSQIALTKAVASSTLLFTPPSMIGTSKGCGRLV